MKDVLTLRDRKKARVDEIRAAFAILRRELADYANRHGGRFIVYGSAASGTFHFESDIDILVDFGEEGLGASLDFVERECARLRLAADVQPKSWCTAEFIQKITPNVSFGGSAPDSCQTN
jgi:predicted nucleotidyltransferase